MGEGFGHWKMRSHHHAQELPVAQSKVTTPELCYERALSPAMRDTSKNINDTEFRFGFGGKPFSICINSDTLTSLQNVTGVHQPVDEASRQRFPQPSISGIKGLTACTDSRIINVFL
ncbi:hypothetical protein BO94DRAFT_571545 [Aspergillus sclerotioniger CBS 115572]|uniref:Uncharacterized protein n=1 Tax=Aspergillus sclerotioniger CBS 115572 TaxID=1450535 RepID=A0A317XC39_9EURO|nr:hypothetical protein BO94DRAFT_571545 [Aspergillus sclerotioniger CBS 115572]PWY96103.1 hypothetical protein BO94DRAFT_571545 [Aspergillus sclerotioniger CBS 115572]